VQVTDRQGDIVDEISLSGSGPVLKLDWDKDGEILAILQEGESIVPLWSSSTRRVMSLDTNLRDPSFLAWSKSGPQLAIGTMKGNMLLYNKDKKQKIPIVGKHAKRITCGAWSAVGNRLVLGSDDKTLTISNSAGDTVIHTELKFTPLETKLSNSKGPGAGGKAVEDDVISANLGGKSLLLFNFLDENEDPVELSFASGSSGVCKYGELLTHTWFDTTKLLVGFSDGYIIITSTEPSEIGKEKFSQKLHRNLVSLSYNEPLKKLASAGSDGVRIMDTNTMAEQTEAFIAPADLEDGRITDVEWSPDHQILTVATTAGNLYSFLAKMSVLNSCYRSSLVYLSSLREVSVVDAARKSKPIGIPLLLEPSIVGIGSKHIAAGMNNRVYYHRITATQTSSSQPFDFDYMGNVTDIRLNNVFAAVLTDAKAKLHPIEDSPNSKSQTKTFPSRQEGAFSRITCIALTDDFFLYGTEAGSVEIFFLQDWAFLSGAELRLDHPIKSLHPNSSGTRIVVVDVKNNIFLYNPVNGGGVNQSITRFEDLSSSVTNVMWDLEEKNLIIIYDGRCIHSYLYAPVSRKGPLLTKLGPVEISSDGGVNLVPEKTEISSGSAPILSINGQLTCQSPNGQLTRVTHPFFSELPGQDRSSPVRRHGGRGEDPEILQHRFCQSLALLKLEQAWLAALDLDKRKYWLALSGKAMEMLNVELAARVYRQMGDAGMVMALQSIQHIEDRNLLAGHLSSLFCEYQRAQELFLASSNPVAALEMRQDLLQWDQALKLASTLAPARLPEVCIHYGQQQEMRSNTDEALRLFETALNSTGEDGGNATISPKLLSTARMGVARCNLRMGNLRQGIRLASEINDPILLEDCGDILETQKQYSDAASLYIKADNFDKAGNMYVKYLITADKSRIAEAAPIMAKVRNDRLNTSFGKLCQKLGHYQEAAQAFQRAHDLDTVVQLKLRHLDQVQGAFDLIRETSSAQGAQYVADYCMEVNDFRGAIEFLLIANKSDEAFKLAQSHGIVDQYAAVLGDTMCTEDALKVAHYYEKLLDHGRAGKFYAMCGQFSRALKLFMQCGDREIPAAIDVVGKSENETLTHTLLDFLIGETDGVPKDPNHIYRLYMALKNYSQAANTAIIIARQEQELGNYVVAHSVIVETIQNLEANSISVSQQLRTLFVLLHSYLLVKSLVRRNDHHGAARMLLRVVLNASKFPLHVVNILTSTVIECQRAGLKVSAYEHAVTLMRPEHRPSINVDLKRKIEAIVRRRQAGSEETPEELTPCPVSGEMIPASQLECPSTRDALPMCIISGRHLVISDWCFCPNSKFPALYSEYMVYYEAELALHTEESKSGMSEAGAPTQVTDPLLKLPLNHSQLRLATEEEAKEYIRKYNNVKTEEEIEAEKKAKEKASSEAATTKKASVKTKASSRDARRKPRRIALNE
jgi:WD repeat-containing protein 19